jgi:hypothetical protein
MRRGQAYPPVDVDVRDGVDKPLVMVGRAIIAAD